MKEYKSGDYVQVADERHAGRWGRIVRFSEDGREAIVQFGILFKPEPFAVKDLRPTYEDRM